MANIKRFKYYQPNDKDVENHIGDCVIRSICKALNKEWLEVFDELVEIAREIQAMPNSEHTYHKYLENHGFSWIGLKIEKGKKRPKVKTFYKVAPKGTYLVKVAGHIVTVVDGYYYDTWDSGERSVYGYWTKN